MKKIVSLLLALSLFFLLPSCTEKEKPLDPDGGESMRDVKYLGWLFSVTDGTYLFSSYRALAPEQENGTGNGKLNLATGVASHICRDETCDHTANSGCKAPESGMICFAWNHKLFFPAYEEEWSADHTEYLGRYGVTASYDVETGEYRTYDRYLENSYSFLYSPVLDGNVMYSARKLPVTKEPESEEDYRMSFYATDLETGERTVLFTAEDNPTLGTVRNLLFVDGGWAYFYGGTAGTFLRISIDGKKTEVLLTAPVCTDSFSVSYYDGWLYYLSAAGEDASVLRLTRLNAESKTVGILSDEAVRWFLITNRHIYYEINDGPVSESFADRTARIGCRNLDGSEARVIGTVTGFSPTDALYGDGGLYLMRGASRFYRMDVQTGECISVTGDGWQKAE